MKLVVLIALITAILVGCTKGVSKVNYKFMPSNSKGVAVKVGDIEITEPTLLKGLSLTSIKLK